MKVLSRVVALLFALVAVGCSRGGHDHASHASGGGHVHQAPHGGILVELGDHAANVEIVPGEGRIDLYVLDAHAEQFVRIPQPAIAGTAETASGTLPIVFAAVADATTGETVGNTSRFSAPWPMALPRSLHLDGIAIRGATYDHVHVDLPARPAAGDGNTASR